MSSHNEVERTNNTSTKKDFSEITNAYDFFKKHSTEYQADWNAIVSQLKKLGLLKSEISILDFGGGDGKFLFDLYTNTQLKRINPKLFFYEPITAFKKTAKLRFNSIGYHHLSILNTINDTPDTTIDLIFANHVLYYVDDLENTLLQLKLKLSKKGQMWILMADENNSLVKLWDLFFCQIKMNIPYFLSKDLRSILRKQGIKYVEIKNIKSNLTFINSVENRSNVSRFLLGEHSKKLSDQLINREISIYEKENEIDLPLSDSLFLVKK